MSSIRDIEKPKGCIRVVTRLKESQPACIAEIMRSTRLSRDGVHSSLNRLEELHISRSFERAGQGKPTLCSLTEWGDRLGNIVLALVGTFQDISGKHNVRPYLQMPVGSLSILVYINHNGSMTAGEAVSEVGLCTGSATSALRELRNLGLVCYRRTKEFRRTSKVYELTEDGLCPARYLDIIDMALGWLEVGERFQHVRRATEEEKSYFTEPT